MANQIYSEGNYIVVHPDGLQEKISPKQSTYTAYNGSGFHVYGKEVDLTITEANANTWFQEDGITAYSSASLRTFLLENTQLSSGLVSVGLNSTLNSSSTGLATRPSVYSYEVGLGYRDNESLQNKFSYNLDIDTGTSEIIASFGGAFDPTTMVMSSAQTFTIAYNNTTDGSGQTGALTLLISYLSADATSIESGIHVLGSTGSDVTSFTGLGINRVVVISNGGLGYNANDITVTATTDGTVQARVPSEESVTQQALLHVPQDYTFLTDWLWFAAGKTGGGSSPLITLKGYSWSRVTSTRYDIFDGILDVARQNFLQINKSQPFVLTGREVLWFEASTDTNNTQLYCRFSGVLRPS